MPASIYACRCAAIMHAFGASSKKNTHTFSSLKIMKVSEAKKYGVERFLKAGGAWTLIGLPFDCMHAGLYILYSTRS
jgi:hypothetical protein